MPRISPHHWFWSVSLFLLAFSSLTQFYALRLPQALHLPPQVQVVTNNPKAGVHTRLTGIGDETYIEQTLQQVREMGATWIVDLFPWAYVQPRSRYGYDWNGSDLIIQHAARQGLQVIARLDIVPEWARPQGSSDRLLPPERYQDYAAYVVAFLERYRSLGVRHVIIWNEPNLAFEWGGRSPDPGAYAALLKVVYPQVKAAVPDAVLIAGGLSPGPDIGDGTVRMDDLAYLRALYDAGAGPYFDAWGVHSYGAQQPPDALPADGVVNFRRIELQREMLVAQGDAAKPLYMTEGGWNDSSRWSAAVLPSERVRWTIEAYTLAQQWDWLAAICFWQFSLPQPTHTYQDNWTFVASDGTPKAIYWAVQEALLPKNNRLPEQQP